MELRSDDECPYLPAAAIFWYAHSMSSRNELFALAAREAIIGVVREETIEAAAAVARAYASNGIRLIEITLTTPEAFDLIQKLTEDYSDKGIILAAGTVRSTNDAAAARRAGARIIVSPHTDARIIEYANENDLLSIAGAATATEIVHAWELGCDIVKVYPAQLLGGPDYFRTVRQPIRDIPMLAGGPVPLDAVEAYLDAGAIAVNLGGSLAVPDLVRSSQWDEIGRRVILATSIVQSRRSSEEASSPYVH
jgi:2-dehydro-3-deoxyphosphogluconate aldolase/(4S)-4-hydroxy-2-oxoglutarate aldolase